MELRQWLRATQAVIRGERDADVPCDGCTACCTASQFILVGPDETDTLASIPGELLFTAPGAPDGFLVMGYDEHGHCPMFADGACSIYDTRPRTCRAYDCRIYAATGIDVGEPVATAVARWRFDDDALLAALHAAAEHARARPDAPRNPLHLAEITIMSVDFA